MDQPNEIVCMMLKEKEDEEKEVTRCSKDIPKNESIEGVDDRIS